MNYWQRWVGDWKRKTAHLSACEKGIYGELLDYCYANDTPIIPIDPRAACRIAGASGREECAAVSAILAQFFERTETGFLHSRVAEEMAKRAVYSEAQRALAKRRWDKEEAQAKKANGAKPPDDSPVVATLPLIDGSDYEVRQSFLAELEPLYPLVDIPSSLPLMKGWLISKPERRKTRRGIKAFITSWLAKEQTEYAAQTQAR